MQTSSWGQPGVFRSGDIYFRHWEIKWSVGRTVWILGLQFTTPAKSGCWAVGLGLGPALVKISWGGIAGYAWNTEYAQP